MKTGLKLFAGMLVMFFALTTINGEAFAEEGKMEISKISTIKTTLEANTGKTVTLRIGSGEEVTGTVVLVGNDVVHISKLSKRDFYDAVVRIDSIDAVIVKVRDK